MVKSILCHAGGKLVLALPAAALLSIGILLGVLATVVIRNGRPPRFPETLLRASSAHSGQTFAMATGRIDEDVEGLFTLDYLTGDLRCSVYYPNVMRFGATFKHNVIADLGVLQGKSPNYAMVTGEANFPRGAGASSPASCIVYVADANTGNVAAYTILWNRTVARAGAAQAGGFQLLGTGKGRTLELRD
ncbi:MAG: hypothetical protein MUE50_01350 [Pirellulaceae bacterium]|jgi:hypothetical protein|nr:hypothetical protein [Pirellulaceae bacterium]MCU0977741.1 hypothetical protein [Pirellulaceae bacterium]